MLMRTISGYLTSQGVSNECLYTFGNGNYPNTIKYGTDFGVKLNALRSRITGRYGFVSDDFTRTLIKHIESYQPDLIQIHVIHGHDLNMKTFFSYLKEKKIPVVYTFHDTWPFTGYCPNYDDAHCGKWKTECNTCPVYRTYSWFTDNSKQNHNDKITAISGIPNIRIVTPSSWMKQQVNESRLKELPIAVIPNGIDTTIFQPRTSNLKEELGIQDKKMVLAVAIEISESKGSNDLIALSKLLPDSYQLVLVGVPEEKKKLFPDNVICCPRTSSREKLAEFYSAADVLVNPTHGDNFPTVNLEALACGTPVVTYDVGGSPETIDEQTGLVVPPMDVEALCDAVIKVADNKNSWSAACRKRAVECFDQEVFARNYYNLYQSMLNV